MPQKDSAWFLSQQLRGYGQRGSRYSPILQHSTLHWILSCSNAVWASYPRSASCSPPYLRPCLAEDRDEMEKTAISTREQVIEDYNARAKSLVPLSVEDSVVLQDPSGRIH